MIGSRKTEFEYFDLDRLTVDGQTVGFISATVTVETRKTKARNEWVSEHPRWYGQIVGDFYRLEVKNLHAMVGHTSLGVTLMGDFLVGWAHTRGVDFTGSGVLHLFS